MEYTRPFSLDCWQTFILRVLFSLVVFTFSLLKTGGGDSALFRIATGPQCSIATIPNIILHRLLFLLVYKEEKRSADSLLQHFSRNQPCGSSFLSTLKSLFNRENKIGRGVSFIGGTHVGNMSPSIVKVVGLVTYFFSCEVGERGIFLLPFSRYYLLMCLLVLLKRRLQSEYIWKFLYRMRTY